MKNKWSPSRPQVEFYSWHVAEQWQRPSCSSLPHVKKSTVYRDTTADALLEHHHASAVVQIKLRSRARFPRQDLRSGSNCDKVKCSDLPHKHNLQCRRDQTRRSRQARALFPSKAPTSIVAWTFHNHFLHLCGGKLIGFLQRLHVAPAMIKFLFRSRILT